MDQNSAQTTNYPPIDNTDKSEKSSHYFIIITIILALALIASTCFYFITLKSQNDEISYLKEEISHLNNSSNNPPSAQDPTTETDKADNTTVEQSSQSGPYIADGFFFVPEWGTKFQLSDQLTDYGYAVAQDSLSASYGPYQIGLTAVQNSDLISQPQDQYYDDIFSCSMVTVNKTNKDMSNVVGPRAVIPYDDASLVITSYSGSTHCSFDLHREQVIDQLVEIFSHPIAI